MKFFQHPVWAMAFRPLYSLTAVYGALSVLLWSFGYQGTPQLPGFLWHAHEMIWGYAGGVVVAFLLTAVATWTGKPPVSGQRLALLVGLWLLARLFAFIPNAALLSGVAGTAFYYDGLGNDHMRLSFCYPTPERIREGVRRLSTVVNAEKDIVDMFGTDDNPSSR